MVFKRIWMYEDKFAPGRAIIVSARTKRGAIKKIKREIPFDGYKKWLNKADLKTPDILVYVKYLNDFIG